MKGILQIVPFVDTPSIFILNSNPTSQYGFFNIAIPITFLNVGENTAERISPIILFSLSFNCDIFHYISVRGVKDISW